MTPEQERFDANLRLLLSLEFEGLDQNGRKNLMDSIADIEEEYDAARKIADDKSLTAEQRKYGKDLSEAIAKSLPNITKGVLSAVRAFQKGDSIAGSAAIMEIVAAAIPVFTSLFAAAGPEGMVVGALFSVIGQILTFFAPPSESLKDQIAKMFENFEAVEHLAEMKAVGLSITGYTTQLRKACKAMPGILALPLKSERDADAFRRRLTNLEIGLDINQRKLDVPTFTTWKVAGWLMNPENQEKERWPEVLGTWCQAYHDLVTANMLLNCVANPKKIDELLTETSETNTGSPLPPIAKSAVHTLLITLEAMTSAYRDDWEAWNTVALGVLNEIQSAARDRGLWVHIGTDNYLYGATGRKQVQSSWTYLKLGSGYASRFSITVPKGQLNSLTPEYHVFLCKKYVSGGAVTHAKIGAATLKTFGEVEISGQKFSDIWALPAPKDQKARDPEASFVYVAHDGGASGSVKLFELDAKDKLTDGNWNPGTHSGLVNLRAVTHPPVTLSDDPDKDAMPIGSLLVRGTDHYNSILYGALRASNQIYVDQSNTRCYVPSPWPSYSGIVADDYYLWVFRPEGFACATHASVISCIQGKRPTPRWMESRPTDILGDQSSAGQNNFWLVNRRETKPRPPLKGLISLSPCQDGTLYASSYKRTISKEDIGHWLYKATDTLGSYTAVYRIDLKAGTINVGAWKKIGGEALQVQKMPIPCWSLFESLKSDLQIPTDNKAMKKRA